MFKNIYPTWKNSLSPAIFSQGKFFSYQNFYQDIEQLASFEPTPKIWVLNIEKSYEYLVVLIYCIIYQKTFVPLPPDLPLERQKLILNALTPYTYYSFKDKKNIRGIENNKNILGDYIIFSSGSTGHPKGILGNLQAVDRVICHQKTIFNLKPESHFLWLLNTGFDASLSDILTTFYTHACLYLPDFKLSQIKKLQDFIFKHQITHTDIPPSVLNILKPSHYLSSLSTLIIGGELCSKESLLLWGDKVLLINCYGPTETTICSSYAIFNTQSNPRNITNLINGNTFYLKQGEQINELSTSHGYGELIIGGENLSFGYLDNFSLNEQKFLSSKKLYLTGDLVLKNHEGLFFIGRVDRQVKVHGVLIHPEEIEGVIMHIINSPGCIVKKIGEHLQAWIIGSENDEKFLKEELPKYFKAEMQPKKFHFVDDLPKNSNGKIDIGVIQ